MNDKSSFFPRLFHRKGSMKIKDALNELSKPVLYDFGFIGNKLIALICLPFVFCNRG